MKIIISACLAGIPCRYDGCPVPWQLYDALRIKHELIPLCPELLGGLKAPRPPAERVGDRVLDKTGADLTEVFDRGTEEGLRLAVTLGADAAILKERSPTCGVHIIYDGTFSSRQIEGKGVFAQKLEEAGFSVFGEFQTEKIKEFFGC